MGNNVFSMIWSRDYERKMKSLSNNNDCASQSILLCNLYMEWLRPAVCDVRGSNAADNWPSEERKRKRGIWREYG